MLASPGRIKHDVCVQFNNGERVFHVIEHTPEALDTWLKALHIKVKGRIAVAIELKKGPVVFALQKNRLSLFFLFTRYRLLATGRPFGPVGQKTIRRMQNWHWN